MFNSVRPHRRQPTRISSPWDSPGKNTGVRCHFVLQTGLLLFLQMLSLWHSGKAAAGQDYQELKIRIAVLFLRLTRNVHITSPTFFLVKSSNKSVQIPGLGTTQGYTASRHVSLRITKVTYYLTRSALGADLCV